MRIGRSTHVGGAVPHLFPYASIVLVAAKGREKTPLLSEFRERLAPGKDAARGCEPTL